MLSALRTAGAVGTRRLASTQAIASNSEAPKGIATTGKLKFQIISLKNY